MDSFPSNHSAPVFLTTREAAKVLRLSSKTLEKLRCTGGGPSFRKLGKRVLYMYGDLTAWADANLRHSTSDPGPGQLSRPIKPAA